jgi:hypothetical protein
MKQTPRPDLDLLSLSKKHNFTTPEYIDLATIQSMTLGKEIATTIKRHYVNFKYFKENTVEPEKDIGG